MDENVIIKVEHGWYGPDEAQNFLSSKVKTEVPIDEDLRGIDLITQSSYSATVNLAQIAVQAKQEQQDDVTESPANFEFVEVYVDRAHLNSELCHTSKLFSSTADNEHHFNPNRPIRIKCDDEDFKMVTSKISHQNSEDNNSSVPSEETSHDCDICQQRFSSYVDLNQHKITHSIEKHFKCDMCQKTMFQKRDLTRHMRTHTRVKSYSCDFCEARFSVKGNLTQHKRTHTGEKPFSCELCKARFSQKGILTAHKRTHTGEKPFSCDLCEARFSDRGNFTRHKRTHTGEKPFPCDLCEARFNHRGNLTRHKRTHTERNLSPVTSLKQDSLIGRTELNTK